MHDADLASEKYCWACASTCVGVGVLNRRSSAGFCERGLEVVALPPTIAVANCRCLILEIIGKKKWKVG